MERIGIDIDGVLTDTRSLVYKSLARRHSRIFGNLTNHNIVNHPKFNQYKDEFYGEPANILDATPLPGTLHAVRLLAHPKTVTTEIHIVSLRNNALHEATRLWLERYKFLRYIHSEHVHLGEPALGTKFKTDIAREVGLSTFYDDSENIILAMASLGLFSYYVTYESNINIANKNIHSVRSLIEGVKHFIRSHNKTNI
jgi:hypothetical protein